MLKSNYMFIVYLQHEEKEENMKKIFSYFCLINQIPYIKVLFFFKIFVIV